MCIVVAHKRGKDGNKITGKVVCREVGKGYCGGVECLACGPSRLHKRGTFPQNCVDGGRAGEK